MERKLVWSYFEGSEVGIDKNCFGKKFIAGLEVYGNGFLTSVYDVYVDL